MIYYIIKSIIPCVLGWIGCEIYHRWEVRNDKRRSNKRIKNKSQS